MKVGGCLRFEEGGDERIVVAKGDDYGLKRLKVGSGFGGCVGEAEEERVGEERVAAE